MYLPIRADVDTEGILKELNEIRQKAIELERMSSKVIKNITLTCGPEKGTDPQGN